MDRMSNARRLMGSLVVLYFVIALEVLVMISPFAAFFYAVLNPFLLLLARSPATRWLADFFLPHMVLPPGPFLKAVRVAGSVLFVVGALAFLVCAGQVYFHKLARRGPVLGGPYAWIRHPQYVALACTGLGLAVLWPRFLTVVLWAVMVALYHVLARDEERRMVAAFGDGYRSYMSRTGMFVPLRLERAFGRVLGPVPRAVRAPLGLALASAFAVGCAFALRAFTVGHLPLWSDGRAVALPVLGSDMQMLDHRMADVLRMPEVRSRLDRGSGAVLAYVVPVRYVMQGMIADTDPAYRLYEHHQTVPMIIDWIVHPFRHLEGGHAMGHHGGAPSGEASRVRRVIFLRVATGGAEAARRPASLFAIDAERTPQFFADVDMHALALGQVRDLGPGTGWGRVPTPMF
jgi:protein-S-isoprenylcysteine O-methyltransferase Ste14